MLVQKSRKLTEMKAIENAESIGRNTGIMEGSGTEIQMEVPIDSFWSGYINPYHEDYEVWIEDNHSVAYAYLVQNGRIISDVWLYNHGVSPKTPEWDDPSKMPFKQAQCFMNEYADKIEPIESDNDFDLVWCDSGASVGVAIVIKGVPCALLTSDNVPSFSTCVNRDNPLALHIDVTELLSIINS